MTCIWPWAKIDVQRNNMQPHLCGIPAPARGYAAFKCSSSSVRPPSSRRSKPTFRDIKINQIMSSLPTRSRADQPNSGVWEQHKETLRQLYLLQSKPLKEVMAFMRKEYNFEATDKMYKYHFKRWNFRKNMTKHESQSYEADAVAGRAVILPSSNGRQLGSQRLRTRIQKSANSSVAKGFLGYAQYRMQRPVVIPSPDALSPAERALKAVQAHSRARFKSWDLDEYRQDTSFAESWAAAACLAGLAISKKQNMESNFIILNRSGAEVPLILQRQEPTLVWSTLTVIVQLLRVLPEIGNTFIKVVAEFCTVLPLDDPLRDLWAAISKMDPGQIPALVAQLREAQLDFLHRKVAPDNGFVLNYIRTSAKYLHDRKLLQPQATHDQMDKIIREIGPSLNHGSDTPAYTKNVLIAAYLFKACIHLDAEEYEQVEALLRKVDPEVHHIEGMSDPQIVNFYEIKAEMLLERGDFDNSERYYWRAHDTAQETMSETMPSRIGHFYVALENLYKQTGDAQMLTTVRKMYDDHVRLMTGEIVHHPPSSVTGSVIQELEEDGDVV